MVNKNVVEGLARTVPVYVRWCQFNGHNSVRVAKWINENTQREATARGRYISVKSQYENYTVNMTKGDILVVHTVDDTDFTHAEIYDAEQFNRQFVEVGEKIDV